MNGSLEPGQTAAGGQQRHRLWRQRWGLWGWGIGYLTVAGIAVERVAGQPAPAAIAHPTGMLVAEALTRPTLKAGSQGADVTELQATLTLLGFFDGSVNGVYGETTVAAVSRFQQAAGLSADGVVGPATWNRLFPPSTAVLPTVTPAPTKPTTPTPASTGAPANKPATTAAATSPATTKPVTNSQSPSNLATFPILRLGMKGPAVTGLQQRLRAIGVFKGATDGVFGPETQESVKAAQRKFKLDPDGVVGPATWTELMQ